MEFSSGERYVLSSVHNKQPDVPSENLINIFKAELK